MKKSLFKIHQEAYAQCGPAVLPWYAKHAFPLVPQIITRGASEHNTASFMFNWMFFRLWTLDSFGFEFSVVMDTHWGVGIAAILPYLRLVAAIPCPDSLSMWFYKRLWLQPKKKEVIEPCMPVTQ